MSLTLTGTITDRQDGFPIERANVRLFRGATSLGSVRAAAVHREGVVAWTRILTGIELGVAILPMTGAACRTHKYGRQSMLRVRHRELWS